MGLFDFFRGSGGRQTALFVDGPNIFRPEFTVDFDVLLDVAARSGNVRIARLFVDENASAGLIRAAEAHGFAVTVTSGDVDVRLAVEATDLLHSSAIDTLAIASRDADFTPVFEKAAHRGIRTVAIAPGTHGQSAALTNAADEAIVLES